MRWRDKAMLICVAVATAAWGVAASAGQYYKWTDANGTTHFSAVPPQGARAKMITIHDGAPARVLPPQDASDATGSGKAAAPITALRQADEVAVRNNCITARHNLATLQGSRVVMKRSADDLNKALDAQQRKQAVANARAQEAKYCQQGK